ncbi:hypothetical protein GVX81_06835 [[Haemophilus] felis]|uniref:Uncharacterized protein n=1 Tax=[Haemophilus] felis TaxID=123822 RepID=A0A1T0B618_9PAST|nr:hypothetical protein [[Haemophilus] felis]NBI40819.1 hypothetical protein [[Haemophilus] felis]OOS05524.1 hypothetical protein B0188_03695 [[Haemophilus] felis]
MTGTSGLSRKPYKPVGAEYDLPETLTTDGVVSVGGKRDDGAVGLRRIVNAAPGALDTDVATVGQLRQLASVTQKAAAGVQYFSTYKLTNNTNQDNKGATAKDSLAIGNAQTGSSAERSIAIGTIGSNPNSTDKNVATAEGTTSIAIGSGAYGKGADGIAIWWWK